MKKTLSILSGMALVAALGAPAFAQPTEIEISEINAAAWVEASAVAQEGSTAEMDNSYTETTTTTNTTTTTTEEDFSTNNSYNTEQKDNVLVEAKLVQISANIAEPVLVAVGVNGDLRAPAVTNKIEMENAANDFSGISNINLNSGYFNNAASQVTFGVR